MSEGDIRQFVHHLLFNYAKAHLTVDHHAYSRDLYNLLKPFFVKPVPLADPNAFTIPVDPFDALFKLHDIHQLPRYEERFRVNHEAIRLLKQHTQTRSEPPKTERILLDDKCDFPGLQEPFMAALTRRSVRAGPFGTQSPRHYFPPSTISALLLQAGIAPVREEAVQEIEISNERLLKTLWALDHEQLKQIRSLMKAVTDMRRPQPDYKNSMLHAFLHGDDSLPALVSEPEFIPLFPRSRRFGHGRLRVDTDIMQEQKVKELVQMFPEVKMESDDSDDAILQANLEIVGGWHTLRVSSPISIATPTTSQEDERIDQLFLENSPATDPMIGLMNERIEEIEIPRSRRIGGTQGKGGHILHGKTLGTFLPAMLKIETTSALNDIKAQHYPPSPQSMLGQASMDTDAIESGCGHDDWQSFNMDIQNLCPIDDPFDIIMNTRLEESDNIFMQVPQLASPNALRPTSLALPANLSDLVRDVDDRRKLKKNLKGLPALRLSLSWVTFTVDAPPSHQEAASVYAPILDPVVKKSVDDLLKRSCFEGAPVVEMRFNSLDEEALELLGTLAQESKPFIAVSRRFRQSFLSGAGSQRASVPSGCVSAEAGLPSSVVSTEHLELGQPLAEPQDEFSDFAYEPSVLRFEDIIDARMFYEPPTSDPLQLSSVDNALMAVDDSAIAEANAPLLDLDRALVNAGFMDSVAPFVLTGENPSGTDLDSHISRLAEFTRLRAKICGTTNMATIPADLPPSSDPTNRPSPVSDEIANTIMDPSTLFLLEPMPIMKKQAHQYMASLDFVQKQAIVRLLRTEEWNVDLAERASLGGVDLIVDPRSAIIVASLFTLPSRGQQLVHRISEHSWDFKHLLVLLEAYPDSVALRPSKSRTSTDAPSISAYTPPILKAIRKLRRDVVIGEACGKKWFGCKVEYGFVNDVREAASFVRYFGEMAERRDETGGVLWQPRAWLDAETSQDEQDLANVRGLNPMSATILLCQATTEEILNMSPEQRIEEFGFLIGVDAVNMLNEALNRRLEMMMESSSRDENSSFAG